MPIELRPTFVAARRIAEHARRNIPATHGRQPPRSSKAPEQRPKLGAAQRPALGTAKRWALDEEATQRAKHTGDKFALPAPVEQRRPQDTEGGLQVGSPRVAVQRRQTNDFLQRLLHHPHNWRIVAQLRTWIDQFFAEPNTLLHRLAICALCYTGAYIGYAVGSAAIAAGSLFFGGFALVAAAGLAAAGTRQAQEILAAGSELVAALCENHPHLLATVGGGCAALYGAIACGMGNPLGLVAVVGAGCIGGRGVSVGYSAIAERIVFILLLVTLCAIACALVAVLVASR